MRKIILNMTTSLDGSIEGPDQAMDWHLVHGELRQRFIDRAGQWTVVGRF